MVRIAHKDVFVLSSKTAVLACTFFVYCVVYLIGTMYFQYNPSSFALTGEMSARQIEHEKISNHVILEESAGYDGQFYFALALHPFQQLIGYSPHWHQRLLYPLVGEMLSFGNPQLLAVALVAVNGITVLVSTWVLMLIIQKAGGIIWLALLWPLSAGMLVSFTRDLTEPLLYTCILLAYYFLQKEKAFYAAVAFALALLTREVGLYILATTVIYFAVTHSWRKVGVLLLSTAPFFLWQVVLFILYGSVALFEDGQHFSSPFVGLIQYVSTYQPEFALRDAFFWASGVFWIGLAMLQAGLLIRERQFSVSLAWALLVGQIIFVLSLSGLVLGGQVYGISRHALGLLLFSILYYTEERKTYPKSLALLSILGFLLYFLSLPFFRPEYYLT